MSRSENYVEDVPMRLSRKFEPFYFESEPLPDVRSQESLIREFTYEFNVELCALEVADRRSKEICDEAEKVRQKQLKQQEVDRMNHMQQQQQQHQQQPQPPILHQHAVPAPLFSSSLQVLPNHPAGGAQHTASPSPPAPPVPPSSAQMFHPGMGFSGGNHQTAPSGQQHQLPLPSSCSQHAHSVPASPLSHEKQQLHQGVQVPVPSIGNMSSSVPSGNFMALCATTSAGNPSSAGPPVMTLTNGGPNDTAASYSSHSASSGYQSKGVTNGPGEVQRLKPINTKEFEDFVGSSPFDDALLRSIDDKQELNSVFANVAPQPPNHNNSSSHHFNGPNHSAYCNFNPR